MSVLWLDTETHSAIPIAHGTHKYAEGAEVILVSLAIDDDPAVVWDTSDPESRGSQMSALQDQINRSDEIILHNSAFDRTVLKHHGVHIPVEKITDTMVVALMHSLPAGLGQLCEALDVPTDKAKDKDGKRLIHLFCKPQPKNRRIERATRETHPEDWEKFKEYARLDIEAMRECLKRMPRWNDTPEERELWRIDQIINDRGIAADLELAEKAQHAFRRSSKLMAARINELTDGAVPSATQRAKLLDYLVLDQACYVEDMTKGTLAAALQDADLPPGTRELLEIRQQAAATSPAKYKTILNATSSDGRIRGLIQFCGASRSGRDAGRTFQPQNLPRPTLPADEVERGIAAIKADCEDMLFDNVSEICVNAVRGCLVAEPGNKLLVADLSNIEGRILAWLAGEEWKTKAFKDFDRGVGHDLYILAYARAFGMRPEDVAKAMRQIGKVMELALGYQGAVGAFNSMAGNYGVVLPEDTVVELVRAWRRANSRINSFWYEVEDAAKAAIRNPDESFRVRDLAFSMKNGWLRMRLPSGRYLSYPKAQIGVPCRDCNGTKEVLGPTGVDSIVCRTCGGNGLDDTQIRYMGTNQYTRKWEMLETYGGKFVENATQSIARDIFLNGMRRAELAGYPVVLRVHDELGCEVPDDPSYTVEALCGFMTAGEHWSFGLPLAAAGHSMFRYAKED